MKSVDVIFSEIDVNWKHAKLNNHYVHDKVIVHYPTILGTKPESRPK